jgi:hypothetical protein
MVGWIGSMGNLAARPDSRSRISSMPFTVRVRLLDASFPRARVLVRMPKFDWSREFDGSGTIDADVPADDLYLEVGALLPGSPAPLFAGVQVAHARGLDIDQINEQTIEANVLHAPAPAIQHRQCELVCLSSHERRPGPGCLDCAVGPYTIRICC